VNLQEGRVLFTGDATLLDRDDELPVTLGLERWHDQGHLVHLSDGQSVHMVHETLVEAKLRQEIDVELEDERGRDVGDRGVSQVINRVQLLDEKATVYTMETDGRVSVSVDAIQIIWRSATI